MANDRYGNGMAELERRLIDVMVAVVTDDIRKGALAGFEKSRKVKGPAVDTMFSWRLLREKLNRTSCTSYPKNSTPTTL
jgi:hypothetical protein